MVEVDGPDRTGHTAPSPRYCPGVEYVTNLMDVSLDPGEWGRRREAEGWHVLSVADHFFTDHRPFPHVWVSAAAIAEATSTVTITTSFTNNLFRSPVEVAQASLQMQNVADGRFELGLGAGWAKGEMSVDCSILRDWSY